MIVETVTRLLPSDVAACDFSFDVTCHLQPPYTDPLAHAVAVDPYRKAYGFDADDFADINGDQLLAVARDEGRILGYILVSRAWNNYAQIDDFAVDRSARRAGIGLLLMDRAVAWAKANGLPGLRLETQSNNVSACRFYQRYGFVLGGYDAQLYSALGTANTEVALFWYLRFESTSTPL